MTSSGLKEAARIRSGGFRFTAHTLLSRLARNGALCILGALCTLGALYILCPAAHAQNALSSYSLVGNVAAGTSSYDYRYTRHSLSSGGRGSRPYIYYSWDPFLDESTNREMPLLWNRRQWVNSFGTFYSPTYSATALATNFLTNTPNQAVLTVRYLAGTTVTTALAAHQSVTVTADPGSTFTFTVPNESDVVVSTTGDSGGVFRLFGYGSGVLLGPFSGTGGPYFLDTPLPPGTYWVTNGLTYTSGVDTQLGTSTNPGKASTSWGFTLTITPTSSGSGGD